MLLGDTKQHREAAMDTGHKTQQTTLGNHFTASTGSVAYSDRAFEAAAIEWLVQTNQVCPIHLPSVFNILIHCV
jgi:hypothetical protein